MRTLQEQIADWCIHFNGIQNTACKIGIPYDGVTDNHKRKVPCIKNHGCAEFCPSAQFPTEEEVTAKVAEINKEVAQFLTTMAENKVCPHCQVPIEKKRKVGRCVYLEPCGHRLGQV
jgi:hypothetical protein